MINLDPRPNVQYQTYPETRDQVPSVPIQVITSQHRNDMYHQHQIPIVTATIGGWTGRILLDTGSTRTLLPADLLNKIQGKVIPPSDIDAMGMSGSVPYHAEIFTDINLFGYDIKNHHCYMIKEPTNTFKDPEITAILGTDVLYRLPPICFD